MLLICLAIPKNVLAEPADGSVYLGEANKYTQAGTGSGVLIIGDENVANLMTTDTSTVYSEPYLYTASDGLKGISIAGQSTFISDQLLNTLGVQNWEVKPEVVVIYTGVSDIKSKASESCYLNLVNTVHSAFPDAIVKCHLITCSPNESDYVKSRIKTFNSYIKSITNVEVVNNFDMSWTDDSFYMESSLLSVDGLHFNSATYNAWKNSIVNNNCVESNVPALSFVNNISMDSSISLTGCAEVTDNGSVESSAEVNISSFIPKVTVLHSVNAAIAAAEKSVYFIPELEDFPVDLEALVESGKYDNSGLYHGFAAVYPKEFDLEAKSQMPTSNKDGAESVDSLYHNTSNNVYKENQSKRELEILGYDFLLSEEACDFKTTGGQVSAKYKATTIDKNVKLGTAVMDIYKALGEYCFDTKISFLPDSQLQPETSPLQSEISILLGDNNGQNWDNSEGACWVFATRTNPDQYWSKCTREGLLGTIKSSNETFTPSKKDDDITLGEFCILLKEMMVLYGEPVLTDTEQQLLLQVYGKNLPTNMCDTEEYTAIKYLAAKGIINLENPEDYMWSSKLELDTMLQMLMAVKDVDSRNTFKDIQLTMDVTLAELGYFPITVNENTSPVTAVAYTNASKHVGSYDYLIPKEELNNSILENFYVPEINTGEDANSNPIYQGVIYVDKKPYVWLSIPIDSNSSDQVITITNNSYSAENVTHTGGVLIGRDLTGFTDKFPDYLIDKTRSTSDASVEYATVDKSDEETFNSDADDDEGAEIQLEDFNQGFTYLSNKKGITVIFSLNKSTWTTDIVKITFAGKKLTTKKNQQIKVTNSDGSKSVYQVQVLSANTNKSQKLIKVTGCADYSEFTNLFKPAEATTRGFEAYQQDKDTVLVSIDFLTHVGLVKSYTFLEDDQLLQLVTANSTVYLSRTYHYVLNGNSIYQVPSDNKLWFEDSNHLYVDYRAVMGWATPFISFNDALTSSVSVTDTWAYSAEHSTAMVYSPEGYASSVEVIGSRIPLNTSYPLANYLMFYTSADASASGADNDILFVFKPKTLVFQNKTLKSEPRTTLSQKYLKQFLGLTLQDSDNVLVYAYPLKRVANTSSGYKKKENPPGVTYDKQRGYMWCADAWTQNGGDASKVYTRYYKSAETKKSFKGYSDKEKKWSNELVLPIVKGTDGKFYDLNVNTFTLGNKVMPYGYMPSKAINDPNINSNELTFTYYNPCNNTHYSMDTTIYNNIDDYVMQPAPTGLGSNFLKLPTENWNRASSSNAKVYYGTMLATFDSNGIWVGGNLISDVTSGQSMTFTVLKETTSNIYLGCNTAFAQAFDTPVVIDGDNGWNDIEISVGESLQQVDWDSINLQNALESADDFLTIATLASINILPRLAMYLFIALIALSLVSNVKPMQVFCDKVFDIYKVLTLGRKDVHTIDTQTIFISSIIGIGIFWLFLDGTVIDLFSWLVRAIVGISTR